LPSGNKAGNEKTKYFVSEENTPYYIGLRNKNPVTKSQRFPFKGK
jgi:hypothetical protein